METKRCFGVVCESFWGCCFACFCECFGVVILGVDFFWVRFWLGFLGLVSFLVFPELILSRKVWLDLGDVFLRGKTLLAVGDFADLG